MTFRKVLRRLPLSQAPTRNWVFLVGDIFLIAAAVLGSFAIRFEWGALFVFYLPQALRMVLVAIIIKPVVYYFFGLYRRLWAYASIRELLLIVAAVTAASIVLSVAVAIMSQKIRRHDNRRCSCTDNIFWYGSGMLCVK